MTRAPTIVIAEAGVNHGGEVDVALQLVDAAAKSGADYIKFQTFSSENLVVRTAGKAAYQVMNSAEDESQYEMLSRLELSKSDHHELVERSRDVGIKFLSTGFDTASIDMLVSLGIEWLKIPSGEITNLPLLRHIGSLSLPILLSTGMSTLVEVEQAVGVLVESGARKEDMVVMHCCSEYPTPVDHVNLNAMLTIGNYLGVNFGLSDHSLGLDIPFAASVMGAKVVEKHFTLDRRMIGPDHQTSLEPLEFEQLILRIRTFEKSLGTGEKNPTGVEIENSLVVRRSIVAAKTIRKNEMFTPENITTKRPATGLSPMLWDSVIGSIADKEYKKDDRISMKAR